MRPLFLLTAAVLLMPSLAAAHAGDPNQTTTTSAGQQTNTGLGAGGETTGNSMDTGNGRGGKGLGSGGGGTGGGGTGTGGGTSGDGPTLHPRPGFDPFGGGRGSGGSGGGTGPGGSGGGGGVGGSATGSGGENTSLTAEQAAALLQGHHIADPHPTKPQGMASMTPAPQAAPPTAAEQPTNLGAKPLISNLDGRGRALTGEEKDSADGHRAAAENRWKMKDYKGVVEETNRALALDPNDEASMRRQGEAYAKLRDYADAETALQRAAAADKSDAKAAEHLAWVQLKRKKPQEAIESANRALAADPNDAAALAIRAFAEEMLGMRDKALADIEAAAAMDPRYKDKADLARAGKRMYDPDEDLTADLTGGRRGGIPPWLPWVAGPAALVGLLLTVLGAASRKNAVAAAPPLPSQTPTMPATQLGGRIGNKYELLRPLGRGGMGEVHEAMDHTLGRVVAVKSMAASLGPLGAKGREMFVREARTVASLHHPAVVEIYEMVEHGETLYLVFELVRGKTLSSILSQRKKLEPMEALRIMEPVCEALDFAHQQGLVHRDIKPANIMITDQGRVKLMDFGIARSLAETRRKTPVAAGAVPAEGVTVIGTPSYMAPEARAGQLRKESDVYALGVTLFEMLSGAPPLEGASTTLSAAAPGLPPALDAVLRAALEPDPDRRTRTPGELLSGLRRALGAA